MDCASEIMAVNLLWQIRNELPGKVLPNLPRKTKTSELASSEFLAVSTSTADDRSSIYSSSAASSSSSTPPSSGVSSSHRISKSLGSSLGMSKVSLNASRSSVASSTNEPVTLFREALRISLRAFLRALLGDSQIAQSQAVKKFLLDDPITLCEEELMDEARRRQMDHVRVKEQQKFYEIAQQRARELDVYMESFRREIVESSKLFSMCFLGSRFWR